ncbi:MAG TPA: hypothetical protein VGB17_13255 [Pyrinomonadaceae bacterium]|jgi:purine-cytosine permease-like protein
MRWKLILIVSLLAAVVGAGATLIIITTLFGSEQSLRTSDLYVMGTLIFPVAAITFAGFFVYRHTARRRPLQALLTALLSTFLTLTALLASSIFLSRPVLAPTPPPVQRNIG